MQKNMSWISILNSCNIFPVYAWSAVIWCLQQIVIIKTVTQIGNAKNNDLSSDIAWIQEVHILF